MKKTVFLFILIVGMACAEKKSTPSKAEQITAYYEGFKNSDYSQIKRTLADSLINIEGDFTTRYSSDSYHELFKWDSVFKPVYKLVSIENQEENPIATVSVSASKFEFLKKNPLIFRQKFYFKSGKIAKTENAGFIDNNFESWGIQRAAIVNWVKLNHPELDGFMNDMTMKGAQNYLKAMELYENSNKDSSDDEL
ncbi:MAG: hypothetical protein AB8B59_00345 [Maribacter sp.]